MTKRERIEAVFLYGIFICYILLLLKILVFSRVSLFELFSSQRASIRSINLIPFRSIAEYASGRSENLRRFAFGNVVGNIAIFIPLGIYLPLLKKGKTGLFYLFVIAMASISVEIIQGAFAIGVSDIDDVILNSLGGALGVLGYKFLLFILGDDKRARTAVTILSSIFGLPVIFYLLLIMKMRF